MSIGKILVFMVLGLAIAACEPAPGLDLKGGWVRAMPPGSGMTAAYGVLSNNTKTTIVLTTFRSQCFDSVSLHRTVVEGGLSKMRPHRPFVLEPNSSMVLEPGGLHMMLMQPQNDSCAGEPVEIVMVAASGEEFRFLLPVEAR